MDQNNTSPDIKRLLLDSVVEIKKLKGALDGYQSRDSEPLAVVGVACRFPGGVNDVDDFFDMLASGRDGVVRMTDERWDMASVYDPDPATPGKMHTPHAGLLDNVADFDAAFFGIGSQEARYMDPQQRVLLETCWEALESACIVPAATRGSRTGVFIGAMNSDYRVLADEISGYMGSGNALSILSGRLSYLFGWHGPSMVVDTACSSSLLTVHLACQSLRRGESDIAVAGGVNLMLSPMTSIATAKANMLSPDGRCKAFDADADGYVRAEGCGLVVLKRLSDALASGDRIWAVVRGSAVNQDGRSQGLTAPNRLAQAALIKAALADSGLACQDVDVVEAHGSGTSLGDPIELTALAESYGAGRAAPLAVSSVKTNFGHAESAAGIAGFIKMTLALRHRMIFPHLHLRNVNRHVDLPSMNLRIPTRSEPWEDAARPRAGAVSSFGFSGTNVHIVMQEYRTDAPEAAREWTARGALPFAFTARTHGDLLQVARTYAGFIESTPDLALSDLSASLNTGREAFFHRLGLMAGDAGELAAQLRHFAATADDPAHLAAEAPYQPPRTAFVFSGQGDVYAGMGRQLYEQCAVFRAHFDACAAAFERHTQVALAALLGFGAEPAPRRLADTEWAQPALYALQVALARTWIAFGVRPSVVLGHSIGEFAAACIAGVFDYADGLALILHRGQLMQRHTVEGMMACVFAPREQVDALIAGHGQLAIAAFNGAANHVVSGAPGAVRQVLAACDAQGIACAVLPVERAFHSPLMRDITAQFAVRAAGIALQAPAIEFVSTVTASAASDALASADYWSRHIEAPVRFADAVGHLLAAGPMLFVEIGPQQTMSGLIRRLQDKSVRCVSSLHESRDAREHWQHALLDLFVHGVPVEWRYPEWGGTWRKCVLPFYPFQRSRHWITDGQAKRRAGVTEAQLHPILGARIATPAPYALFRNVLSPAYPTFLAHHQVGQMPVLPASAYCDLALSAALAEGMALPLQVSGLNIGEALRLTSDGAEMHFVLDRDLNFAYHRLQDDAAAPRWLKHAEGRIVAGAGQAAHAPIDVAAFEQILADGGMPVEPLYAGLAARGLVYGEAFQAIRRIRADQRSVRGYAELTPATAHSAAAYVLHPVLLDCCLHALGAIPSRTGDAAYLPVAIDRLTVHARAHDRIYFRLDCRDADEGGHDILSEFYAPDQIRVDGNLYDAQGGHIAAIDGMVFKRLGGTDDAFGNADWFYRTEWQQRTLRHPRQSADFWRAGDALLAGAHADAPGAHAQAATLAFRSEIDRIAALGVAHAFGRLGLDGFGDEAFGLEQLMSRLGIGAQFTRLVPRLLLMLTAEGRLAHEDGQWRIVGGAGFRHLERDLETGLAGLAQRWTEARHEVALLAACLTGLASVLAGTTDPLQLLFGSDAAALVYSESRAYKTMNRCLGEALRRTVAGLPHGRVLRILEVGAGTGGTTSAILPHVPADRTTYCYTDIGASLLQQAGRKFGEYDFIDYQVFDVEADPRTQAIAGRQFDIVVAANVLHATRDLGAALDNVTALLAPGGCLLLLETVAQSRWLDLTFGLTDGWWNFTDTALRRDYPLLDVDAWTSLLTHKQLQHVESFSPDGSLAIMAARKPLDAGAAGGGSWIVAGQDDADLEPVCAALAQAGQRARALRIGRGADVNDAGLADAMRASTSRPLAGVIYLPARSDAHADAGTAAMAPVYTAALAIVRAVDALGAREAPRLWFATRDTQAVGPADGARDCVAAGLWGMAKAVALEHPDWAMSCVDLEGDDPVLSARLLAAEVTADDGERMIGYRHGSRHVARLLKAEIARPGATRKLRIAERGSIANVRLENVALEGGPGPDEVDIEIRSAGLNFIDVLDVLGLYPDQKDVLGTECAGTVVAVGAAVRGLAVGDRVVAVAPDCFGDRTRTNGALVRRLPAQLGFRAAATIPIAFLTAYHALVTLGNLRRGERVLIHSAAGGVGMAAIQIATALGAEIYATAHPDKWETLARLGVTRVANSRTLDFAGQIAQWSGGGVDLVLNSLTGEAIELGMKLLAPGGRFIEIGKRDRHLWPEERVRAVRGDIRFALFDLMAMCHHSPHDVGRDFDAVLAGFADGRYTPLPALAFDLEDAAKAMRTMQQGRHLGKIVLEPGGNRDGAGPGIASDGTYVVTGGFNGLGLLTAKWLIAQGARHLVLLGRHGDRPGVADLARRADAMRVSLLCVEADVTDCAALDTAFARIRATLPPVAGIVHSAGVLDDGVLLQQDWGKFERVLAVKLQGARNLLRVADSEHLKLFVAYSSIAAVFGSPGQANHAAANAALDALTLQLARQGKRAVTINWGAWAQIGAAAERNVDSRLAGSAMGSIRVDAGLDALHAVLRSGVPQLAVVPIRWQEFGRQFVDRGRHGGFFDELTRAADGQGGADAAADANGLARVLAGAGGASGELAAALQRHFVAYLAGMLGTAPENIAADRPLSLLGVDSLLAVELKNHLKKQGGIDVSIADILGGASIAGLCDRLLASVEAGRPADAAATEAASIARTEYVL